MQNELTRVLVLDDDEDTRFAISRILGKCDCEVAEAESVQDSIELLEQDSIDLIFSDMRIPGSDGGEELLQIVTKEYPSIDVVLMSCAMDDATRTRLIKMGAAECVQKPFYKDTCMEILQNLQEPLKKIA